MAEDEAGSAGAAEQAGDSLPGLARRCWAALDLLHTVLYFAPEPAEEYQAVGLRGRAGYFASRAAPLGPVPPSVVAAMFYVFSPPLVEQVIPSAWVRAEPSVVLEARYRGIGRALRRILGRPGEDPDLLEAEELVRRACAGLTPAGRPLYAAHAALPWPEDPLLALWHGATLLREHRGDGHVAALLLVGLDPVEALVTGGLSTGTTDFLKATRGWTEQEWSAGEDRLRARGLLDEAGGLTPAGVALRAEVESRTDRAALEGWRHLGVEGAERLLGLVQPLGRRVHDADLFPAGWQPRR